MKKEDLVGTWKLIEYVAFNEKGEEFFPYGKNAIGYLIYTLDNHVSVQIMRAYRSFAEEVNSRMLESAENYGGYIGRYELSENTIIHYPEVSSFQTFIGVPQPRECFFQGKNLILKCNHHCMMNGMVVPPSRLTWEKV